MTIMVRGFQVVGGAHPPAAGLLSASCTTAWVLLCLERQHERSAVFAMCAPGPGHLPATPLRPGCFRLLGCAQVRAELWADSAGCL